MHLTGIFIYPIKSLGSISLTEATVQREGLQYDRRWMLLDAAGNFLTQRNLPEMALLQPSIEGNRLRVTHRNGHAGTLEFFLDQPEDFPGFPVQVWDDEVAARSVGGDADEWFSQALRTPCQLVRIEENAMRYDLTGKGGKYVSFADSQPFLIIGEASLAELNRRLDTPLPMARFRPNLVFTGGLPFAEDDWAHFTIGDVHFKNVKPCGRCTVTTIDPATGQVAGAEPLRTLNTFRKVGNQVNFGMNAALPDTQGEAVIRVGDEITGG